MTTFAGHLKIEIQGKLNADVALRYFWAVSMLATGLLLWCQRPDSWSTATEGEIMVRVVAVALLIAAPFVPLRTCVFLDLTAGEVVTERFYGTKLLSRSTQALGRSNQVVVRHLCTKDGEGPDTYTSTVGLKPKTGAVLWIKEFPATPDEVPPEAYDYARWLREALEQAGAAGGGGDSGSSA
jgi:hypothetical protein